MKTIQSIFNKSNLIRKTNTDKIISITNINRITNYHSKHFSFKFNREKIFSSLKQKQEESNQQEDQYNLKAKLKQFFKKVHPDILGRDCSEDLIKQNQKSLQELNNFISSLKENQDFKAKTIEFNVNDGVDSVTITKFDIDLPQIVGNGDKRNQKLYLSNKLDEILSEIQKKDTMAERLGFTKKDDNIDSKNIKISFKKELEEEFGKKDLDYSTMTDEDIIKSKIYKLDINDRNNSNRDKINKEDSDVNDDANSNIKTNSTATTATTKTKVKDELINNDKIKLVKESELKAQRINEKISQEVNKKLADKKIIKKSNYL